MQGRQLHGFAGSVSLNDLLPSVRAEARRRRAAAATVLGFTLFAIAAMFIIPRGASADWRPSGLFSIFSGYRTEVIEPMPMFVEAPLPKPKAKHKARPAVETAQTVCVRLCDGYFFPAPASGQAGCASLCPGAETALYRMPGGSDRIEDAVSASGARYSALPAALSYRTTIANACACRSAPDSTAELMRDPTLRKGDAVMTETGLLVYRGAGSSQHQLRDFSTLAQARLSPDRRVMLAEMERVSVGPARATTRLAQIAPAVTKRPEDQIRLVERTGAGPGIN